MVERRRLWEGRLAVTLVFLCNFWMGPWSRAWEWNAFIRLRRVSHLASAPVLLSSSTASVRALASARGAIEPAGRGSNAAAVLCDGWWQSSIWEMQAAIMGHANEGPKTEAEPEAEPGAGGSPALRWGWAVCVYAVKGAGSGYCAQLKMGDAERQSVTRFL